MELGELNGNGMVIFLAQEVEEMEEMRVAWFGLKAYWVCGVREECEDDARGKRQQRLGTTGQVVIGEQVFISGSDAEPGRREGPEVKFALYKGWKMSELNLLEYRKEEERNSTRLDLDLVFIPVLKAITHGSRRGRSLAAFMIRAFDPALV